MKLERLEPQLKHKKGIKKTKNDLNLLFIYIKYNEGLVEAS